MNQPFANPQIPVALEKVNARRRAVKNLVIRMVRGQIRVRPQFNADALDEALSELTSAAVDLYIEGERPVPMGPDA